MDRQPIYALAAVAAAVLVGAVLGWSVRRTLQREGRRDEVRQMAKPAGVFLFWLATAVGLVVGAGILDPTSLAPLPGRLLSYLPRVLVAGLIVIGGYALATALAAGLGTGLARAAGRTRRQGMAAIRISIMAAAVLLALGQLGVDVTVITLLLAALAFGTAAALALLIGLGGREVARNVAAGRYVKRILRLGDEVSVGKLTGVVVAIHPVTLELQTESPGTTHVPHARLMADPVRVQRASSGP